EAAGGEAAAPALVGLVTRAVPQVDLGTDAAHERGGPRQPGGGEGLGGGERELEATPRAEDEAGGGRDQAGAELGRPRSRQTAVEERPVYVRHEGAAPARHPDPVGGGGPLGRLRHALPP